jgi:signal transduction histidine kinase
LLIKKNQIIEEKARKLDEANSIKNRLFSIIAHDLRNPLSSLQGVIQLIEINATSKEELDEILPQLTNKFENTSILLGNLLEWSISQMEGYKVLLENFDISKLINDRFEILQTRTTNKELAVLLPSDPVFVSADKNMIGIVILNLLSNAVKFTN